MKRLTVLFSLSLAALLLIGCGGQAADTAESTPASTVHTVIAEGHLVPDQGLYLAFPASGRVERVLVERGDRVSEGQVLVRLGDRQQAELAVAGARLAQVNAQQAYDALMRTEGLSRAQAWQAYLEAQKARAAAQIAWDRIDLNDLQDDVDDAQAEVDDRQADLDDAQEDADRYADLGPDSAARRGAEDDLREAQLRYDQAVQKLEALVRSRDLPRAALEAALAAEAEALRSYENAREGPDVDRLALAQAGLDQAEAQLAAAQAALENYDLKAPFAGTVADVNVVTGQSLGPETWVVALVDTGRWYVDTSDLGELDVVDLQIGQAVTVTVDALPDLFLEGTVETISAAPRVQSGDVLYTVRIRLEQGDPALRWGMTTEVTFVNP